MFGEEGPKSFLALVGPVDLIKSAKSVMDSFSTRASLGAAFMRDAEERPVMCDIVGEGNGGAFSCPRKLAAFAVEVFDVVRGRKGLA